MATADPNIDRQIDQQMLATAEEALQHWGLEAAKLRLVSRSENVVFEVEHHEQEHYAMRLHRPGYNTLEELVAECTWSVALNQAGISVPQYLYTLANQPYAQVLLDGTEQSLLVGMIEWLDGVPLASLIAAATGDELLGYFRQLGATMAQAHNQAVAWQPPPGFVRRRWDADGLMGEQPLWGQFWRAPQLSSAHSNILVAARIKIHAMLTKLGESNKHFSLIHADLHPYNMLFDDGRIQLIDFDDCGYGWHMYDIAVALYNYRNHERFIDIRDALAVGYRSLRPLSGSALSLLPMFFLIRALVWLGWINARPELRDDEQVQQHVASLIAQSQEFLARDTDAPDTDAPDTDAPNTDG